MNIQWFKDTFEQLPFQLLDYSVIGLNLLIFLAAGYIIRRYSTSQDELSIRNRILGLRAINLVLFSTYVFAGGIEILFDKNIPHLQQISQTGLTILISYIVMHYVKNWTINRFGKEREVEGEKIRTVSYSSEVIGLIGLVLVSAVAFLVIINTWELSSWLQATSVVGGLLILLFASKEYFLDDLISGLIMHYNDSVDAGAVIRVKEFELVGIILQITLSQTTIRDLVQKHEISLPNSKLRNATVETISNCPRNGFRDYVDFNIGYEHSSEKINLFLECVWYLAKEKEAAINQDTKPKIVVTENGDHAVKWRLLYYVKNPYRIIDVKNLIQTIALEQSMQRNIGLNTPMTHHLLKNDSVQIESNQ